MLAPGKAFADRFPYDSRNARVALVVCLMKNHVSKLALVHKLTAFRALIEVFYFLMFIYDGKSLGKSLAFVTRVRIPLGSQWLMLVITGVLFLLVAMLVDLTPVVDQNFFFSTNDAGIQQTKKIDQRFRRSHRRRICYFRAIRFSTDAAFRPRSSCWMCHRYPGKSFRFAAARRRATEKACLRKRCDV
jgi:hypothetical protein